MKKILRINMIKHLSYLEFLKNKELIQTHWDRWLPSTDREGLKMTKPSFNVIWEQYQSLFYYSQPARTLTAITIWTDFPFHASCKNPFNPTIPTCIQMQDLVSSQQSLLFVTLMCLSIGTPKNNKFSIWKIHYF